MVAAGVLAFLFQDVAWPLKDDPVDQVWSPLLGVVFLVTGASGVTTTVPTLRLADGRPTTFAQPNQGKAATVWRPAA